MMVLNANQVSLLRQGSGAIALLIAMVILVTSPARADSPAEQKHFTTPQQAMAALVSAVKGANNTELLAILGPGSDHLIDSGDKVADQNGRARFLKAFEEKNSFALENDNRAVFLVGQRDYPFPIPIVRQGDFWRFDTQAGLEEILNRRIGRNELHTIEVLQAYTAAQREFACIKRSGGTEFAQRFASSEGAKDGLYWVAGEGEEESPFGPLIARATEEGYADGLDEETPEPFHGYYFKIIKSQGEHASGGAFDYVVDDKMVLGFALVAYPAKYGVLGVMTFIVNQEGVIYEKDLGEQTAEEAAAMTTFDPDGTWRKYEEPVGDGANGR